MATPEQTEQSHAYEDAFIELAKARRQVGRITGRIRDNKEKQHLILGNDDSANEARSILEQEEFELHKALENAYVEVDIKEFAIDVIRNTRIQARTPKPPIDQSARVLSFQSPHGANTALRHRISTPVPDGDTADFPEEDNETPPPIMYRNQFQPRAKFDLPKLKNQLLLQSFLNQVDSCLIEQEWATRSGSTVVYKPSPTIVNKIIEAMTGCEVVHRTALRLLSSRDHDYDWWTIKTELLQKFCNKETLRQQVNLQLKNLKFKGCAPEAVEEFILQTEEAFTTYVVVFPDDAEARIFKRQLLQQLPHSIQETVRFQLELNSTDETDSETVGLDTITAMIRRVARAQHNSSTRKNDDVNYAERADRGTRPRPSEFAAKYPIAFAVFSKANLQLADIPSAAGLLRVHGPKQTWYVVGAKEGTKQTTLLEEVQKRDSRGSVKPWENRAPPPKDAVNRIASACWAPPPIQLAAVMTTGENTASVLIDLVIDSGAGNSYLVLHPKDPLNGACVPITTRNITLANGSCEKINYKVSTAVMVETTEKTYLDAQEIDIFVIHSEMVKKPYILCGRGDMINLKISIDADLNCYIAQQCVFRPSAIDTPVDLDQVCSVQLSTTEPIEKNVNLALQRIVRQGWTPIPTCRGFQLRLREALTDEALDQPGQTHVWEVKPPPNQTETRRHSYNIQQYQNGLFEKLPPELQQKYQDLIRKYEDAGWWTTEPPANQQILPAAPVFLTLSGHDKDGNKKPRLVCDLRDANQDFDCSSDTTSIGNVLNQIRISGPRNLIAGDIEQAFYHIKLEGTVIQLNLGTGHEYYSDRMTFGLSFGTGTLDAVLQKLRKEIETRNDCWFKTFVDDYIMGTDKEDCLELTELLQTWLLLLRRTGFNSNPKKFAALTTAHGYQQLSAIIPELSHSSNNSIQLLGTTITIDYAKQTLCVHCPAHNTELEELLSREQLTKKQYFRIAGMLGYDPLNIHVEQRLLADQIRRTVGKTNIIRGQPKAGWANFPLFADPNEGDRLREVIEKIRGFITNATNNGCTHETPLAGEPGEIILHSDASMIGGGYTVHLKSGEVQSCLMERSWIWADKLHNVHSNIKELRAFLKGIQALAELLDSDNPETTRARISKVVLYSDNKPTVAWTQPAGRPKVTLNVRSMNRIVESIREELGFIRTFVPIDIEHVEGKLNCRADELSRGAQTHDIDQLNHMADTGVDEQLLVAQLITRAETVEELLAEFHRSIAGEDIETSRNKLLAILQINATKEWNKRLNKRDGILTWCDRNTNGTVYQKPYIPATETQMIDLIIKDTHLAAGHSSLDNTTARIREKWFIPKLRSRIRLFIKHCEICQTASAEHWKAIGEQVTSKEVEKNPYDHSEMDVVYINKDWKCLTLTCRSTGHTTWITTDSEETPDILRALQQIVIMTGMPEKLFTDNAAYFRSKSFKQYAPFTNRHAPYAPWENGKSEVLHKLGVDAMRRVIAQNLERKAPGDKYRRDCILRQIGFLLNTRPLKLQSETVITPDLLAYGFTRRDTTASFAQKFGARNRAPEIRAQFNRLYVTQLRERNLSQMIGRNNANWTPHIGKTALVYHPTAGKESMDWTTCKIQDINGKRATIIRKGKLETCNIANLAPFVEE